MPGERAGDIAALFDEKDGKLCVKSGLKSIDWLHLCGQTGVYYLARFDIHHEYRNAFMHMLLWLEGLRLKHVDFSKLVNKKKYDDRSYGIDNLVALEYLMPPNFCTINMHLLLHLPDSLNYTGPVYSTWMFAFERYANHLKSMVQSSPDVAETLARQVQLSEILYFRCLSTEADMNTFDREPYHSKRVVREPTGVIDKLKANEILGEWQLISKWLWTNDALLRIIHEVFKHEVTGRACMQRRAFEAWEPSQNAIKQINAEIRKQRLFSQSLTLDDVHKIKRSKDTEVEVVRCERLVVNDINFCTFSKDGYHKTTNCTIMYDSKDADDKEMTEIARIRGIYRVQSHPLASVPSQWYTLVYVSRYERVSTDAEAENKGLHRFVLMSQADNVQDGEPIIKPDAIHPVNLAAWQSEYPSEVYTVQLNQSEEL